MWRDGVPVSDFLPAGSRANVRFTRRRLNRQIDGRSEKRETTKRTQMREEGGNDKKMRTVVSVICLRTIQLWLPAVRVAYTVA